VVCQCSVFSNLIPGIPDWSCQELGDHGLADLDALLFTCSNGDRRKLTAEQLIERCLPCGIEHHQGIMTCLGCGSVGPRTAWSGYREEIGRGVFGDRDDGVVDCCVQDGVAARRVNGGWLSAGRLDDFEQFLNSRR
jgi:hypothetical protein